MFWLCSTNVSTFLDLYFHFARFVFRLCSTIIRLSLSCVSTKLDLCFGLLDRNRVCFECARLKFGPCSTYVSPVVDLSFNSLHRNRVCSECTWLMFQPCSIHILSVLELCFDFFLPNLCMFRVGSTYVLTVRDLCFDCAQNMFRLC